MEFLEQAKALSKTAPLPPLEDQAKAAAREIQAEIFPGGKPPVEQEWMNFAPMPTDLCRVSPFHPLNKNQLNQREFIQGMVITKSSWGEITYTGPKLSTFDEDVLLAVLAVLDAAKNRREVKHDGVTTYSYEGPLLPLLGLMGIQKSGAAYKRILDALERMTVAGLKLKTSKGSWFMSAILAAAKWDEVKKVLMVTVNPYFFEAYGAGTVSLLDVAKRAALSRPIAKALLRFIQSHRDGKWTGHFLTLAASLNLDPDQPHFAIRRLLKLAIGELKKHKVLSSKSGFKADTDVVTLIRQTESVRGGVKAIEER